MEAVTRGAFAMTLERGWPALDLENNAVEMRGIVKRFGSVVANDHVDLAVRPGEIHCLLGENGAGKSTLVKILFGLYPKDDGQILLDGRPVEIRSPAQAIRLGIGMVHQHFMLVDRLTVLENLIAGMEPARRGLIDYEAARENVRAISKKYGLSVDVDARVEDLSVGEQQRVEILKALLRSAKVLILDEPTAVLTPQEVDELFHVMQSLKSQGMTLIFITHKLRETMAFSDRVTVLRGGRNAGTVHTRDTNPEELAEMMVGRKVMLRIHRPPSEAGQVLLEARDVEVVEPTGRKRLSGINLQVRAGEILGVVGVEGNGQLELEEVLTGLRQPSSGNVVVCGEELWTGRNPSSTPRRFRALGGAHIPSDRLRRGMIDSLPLTRNAILGRQRESVFHHRSLGEFMRPFGGVLAFDSIRRHTLSIVNRLKIRAASPAAPASSLSGGNQQKLVVGRELQFEPKVVVAAQPTRGVDVGAIEQIHRELLDLRAAGKAVLLISAELDELLALSDRLVVIYEGRIVAEGRTEDFTETQLGLLMAGGKNLG